MVTMNRSDMELFNPVGVPLINFLVIDTEKIMGWKYPSSETMLTFQENRDMGDKMLKRCMVKILILNGKQSEEEWHLQMMAEYQRTFPGALLSLDIMAAVPSTWGKVLQDPEGPLCACEDDVGEWVLVGIYVDNPHGTHQES